MSTRVTDLSKNLLSCCGMRPTFSGCAVLKNEASCNWQTYRSCSGAGPAVGGAAEQLDQWVEVRRYSRLAAPRPADKSALHVFSPAVAGAGASKFHRRSRGPAPLHDASVLVTWHQRLQQKSAMMLEEAGVMRGGAVKPLGRLNHVPLPAAVLAVRQVAATDRRGARRDCA